MNSYEFSQWMAYERAHGPLGGQWEAGALSSIQEQLQTVAFLLSQANFADEKTKRGPIPPPKHFPRPNEPPGEPEGDDSDKPENN